MLMKITVFKKKLGGDRVTIATEDFEAFVERIKEDVPGDYIARYRDVYDYLDGKDGWVHYWRIPMVCLSSEYKRNRAGQRVFVAYNGVSMLKVENLNGKAEADKVKRQVKGFPQVLGAFMGGDGHSVVILTLAALPGGGLPQEEKAAELFCAKAYATSVMCVSPSLEFGITIEPPKLDSTCLMTVDEEPYVNEHPVPFIIEQPTGDDVDVLMGNEGAKDRLQRLKPCIESYVTFDKMFNAVYCRVRRSMEDYDESEGAMPVVVRVADACAACGMPEEEVVSHLLWHFYKEDKEEIRGAVQTVYVDYAGSGKSRALSKHQLVAYRLREFFDRRYEIRFNEVLQTTEFRPRQSLQFMFKELDERELNSMHHDACIEGIEPTFGEVDKYVHSTYIPIYNPIREYIDNLPQWDGKDRIEQLADMVPNTNPNWRRLFGRWFLSMVAHWMNCDTTHANATAPILIGAQGYRKSTFCRLLLPSELQNFFTDSIDFRSNVEAERSLSRFLLVNIDEFDQLSERQFAYVKHLFQKPKTNRRKMYSDAIGTQRRYASFIGTSNHREILRDPTGNRRYLCVEVTAPIRVEVPIEYGQLYAQAKHLIHSGERYWLDDEDEALIREANVAFEQETPMEQLVLTRFEKAETESEGVWMRPVDIMGELQKLPAFNRKRDNNLQELGKVLTKLGWKKKRTGAGNAYLLKMKG